MSEAGLGLAIFTVLGLGAGAVISVKGLIDMCKEKNKSKKIISKASTLQEYESAYMNIKEYLKKANKIECKEGFENIISKILQMENNIYREWETDFKKCMSLMTDCIKNKKLSETDVKKEIKNIINNNTKSLKTFEDSALKMLDNIHNNDWVNAHNRQRIITSIDEFEKNKNKSVYFTYSDDYVDIIDGGYKIIKTNNPDDDIFMIHEYTKNNIFNKIYKEICVNIRITV